MSVFSGYLPGSAGGENLRTLRMKLAELANLRTRERLLATPKIAYNWMGDRHRTFAKRSAEISNGLGNIGKDSAVSRQKRHLT